MFKCFGLITTKWHCIKINWKNTILPPKLPPFLWMAPKRPMLAFRPSKLPIAYFLAPSVSLCHLSGWKLSRVHDSFSPKAQKYPYPYTLNSPFLPSKQDNKLT
jgi:hypothetical protein